MAAFNLSANPAKFARIAGALGAHVQGLPTIDAARKALDEIMALCADLGIPARLREAGVTEDTFEEMAEQCAQANYNRWNPRHTTTGDFLSLFRNAY